MCGHRVPNVAVETARASEVTRAPTSAARAP